MKLRFGKGQVDPRLTDLRKWLVKAVKHRPLAKLVALLIAVLIWTLMMAADDSIVVEKAFTDVPVTIQGVDTLRSRGFTVVGGLGSSVTVRMRAAVTRGSYDRATAASFSPRLDLSQITQAGTQRININAAYSTYGEVISFEPPYLELQVEEYISRSRVPVVVREDGERAENVWIASAVADPLQVTVSGPKSLVDRVRRAVVRLPMASVSGEITDDSIASPIELEDAFGEAVSSPLLTITSESVAVDSARIDLEVYPVAEIPVDTLSAVSGIPAHGYRLGDVRITPATVTVAADPNTLSPITELYVTLPLDVDWEDETCTAESALRQVSGCRYISDSSVLIEAQIVPALHTHTYTGLAVEVFGLDAGLDGTLSQPVMSAVVEGPYSQMELLTASRVHLYVDARDVTEAGEYRLEVRCRIDDTDDYACLPERSEVLLTVR